MRKEKFKYQYTYHILPYIYEGRYDEYLTKLLKDTNIIEYRYDKIKDLEIFSYFKKDVLDTIFYEFPYKESENLNIKEKITRLSECESVTFKYDIIDKEKNMITSHMFPISYEIPKYKESILLNIADDIEALKEVGIYIRDRLKHNINLILIMLNEVI